MQIEWVPLIASLAIAQIAGLLGALFTRSAIPKWYVHLKKSDLNPPSWVFGPVWTILYVLMGVAAYLIYVSGADPVLWDEALTLYGVQLVLNVLWSWIFFGGKKPRAAFIELLILWIAIVSTIDIFAIISHAAAWLMLPYLAWTTFAGYLNYRVWQLNS